LPFIGEKKEFFTGLLGDSSTPDSRNGSYPEFPDNSNAMGKSLCPTLLNSQVFLVSSTMLKTLFINRLATDK
jgi:hypothetical protein